MAHMDCKKDKGDKNGERTQFCYNCKYQKKKPHMKHCVDCFGTKENGQLFCYVNWVECPKYNQPIRSK